MKTLYESILDDEDILISNVKKDMYWVNQVKMQLMKCKSHLSFPSKEIQEELNNNDIIKAALNPVFKKFGDFEWGRPFTIFKNIFVSFYHEHRKGGMLSIFEFEYDIQNEQLFVSTMIPKAIEQDYSTSKKTKMDKYIALVEDVRKVAKKDLTDYNKFYKRYKFEI